MKCITVEKCNVGSVLASDVFNDSGVILVARDTVINSFIKEKLIKNGINTVLIYSSSVKDNTETESDLLFEKNYQKAIHTIKSLIEDISKTGKLDIDKLFNTSRCIYNYVCQSDSVISYLSKIQKLDNYLYTHSVNVGFYAMLMAKWLKLPESCVINAIYAGLLHDIGKIKIPSRIINKKGSLTYEEFLEIKKHTIYGYEMVKESKDIDDKVKYCILMHHERMDGSGYPYGISDFNTDIYTKIVSIADVYDAMTTDRVYKKRVSPFEAFQMFLTTEICGFDISILSVFLNNLAKHLIGSDVELNNGQEGKIVYIPPQDIINPVISVRSNYIDLSKVNHIKIMSII